MAWSRLNRTRAAEAVARRTAMLRIGYRGRFDDDGYPLDGHGVEQRGYKAGDPPRRLAWANHIALGYLEYDAADAAQRGGGYHRPGPGEDSGLDDPAVTWPHGYRWDRTR